MRLHRVFVSLFVLTGAQRPSMPLKNVRTAARVYVRETESIPLDERPSLCLVRFLCRWKVKSRLYETFSLDVKTAYKAAMKTRRKLAGGRPDRCTALLLNYSRPTVKWYRNFISSNFTNTAPKLRLSGAVTSLHAPARVKHETSRWSRFCLWQVDRLYFCVPALVLLV